MLFLGTCFIVFSAVVSVGNLLEEKRKRTRQQEFDVAVIGAGFAGLSSALLLGRYMIPTIVFDGGPTRNSVTRHVHGYLGFEGISPQELVRKARQDVSRYSSVTIVRAKVTGAKRDGARFMLFAGGRTFSAKRVIIAAGVQDVKPRIRNFEKFDGNGAWHCPHCDGLESAGKKLAVIVSGDRPLSYAKEFLGWTQDITVFLQPGCRASNEEVAESAMLGIRIVEDQVVEITGNKSRLPKELVCKTGSRHPADVIFYRLGYAVQNRVAEELGCQLDEGFVKVSKSQETTVPDVYAAGDIDTDRHYVVLAAASGALAAISIYEKMLKEAISAKRTA